MNQQHYRAIISYKGSNYFGWQDLGKSNAKPTIQFEILKSLHKISKYAECVVSGASRTDAGVHALGQVAKLSTPLKIDPAKLLMGMNSLLPEDIRLRECEDCAVDFNPNRDAVSKMYRYYFCTNEVSAPTLRDIVAHVPLRKGEGHGAGLNLESMKQACEVFVGKHDFSGFATKDENANSTVRTILELHLLNAGLSDFGNDVYCVEITGSGFLRHMVRYIIGALFEIGRGNIDSAVIEQALRNKQQVKLSSKAKSRGLHLVKVSY